VFFYVTANAGGWFKPFRNNLKRVPFIWPDTCCISAGVDYAGRLIKEHTMANSTKDKAEGTFHEAKGKVKEKVGQMTNNPNLESEGKGEKMGGKVQKKVGDIEKVFEK
jgi:uncharacterized protein YjbJ (UPF0337 family)